jgi:hypothetical protein
LPKHCYSLCAQSNGLTSAVNELDVCCSNRNRNKCKQTAGKQGEHNTAQISTTACLLL